MKSDWISDQAVEHVLAALTPANCLACQISMATGLRIGDVLSLKKEQMLHERISIYEQKTNKIKRVYIPLQLRQQALMQSGPIYVFTSRLNGSKPRTRQAVYKDIRRAARAFRMEERVSPHTMRKIWAVDRRKAGDSAAKIQKQLNHSSRAITEIYMLADELTRQRLNRKNRRKKGVKQNGQENCN